MLFFNLHPAQLMACKKHRIHSITMERTPCFGTCPWYILEITENGQVRYWGKKDAPRVGYFESTISQADAKQLFKRYSSKKLSNAQEEYTANISDIPMIHYTFTIGKEQGQKKVRQANFGPTFFTRLANELDALVAETEWVKKTDPNRE